MTHIENIISGFAPISLNEMSGIRLMNRTDTKYVVSTSILPLILELAQEDYLVQDIEGKRNPDYHTIYLDTSEKAMFISHQNGKKARVKVRVRTYMASDITFFEVKNKNNKGRTDKKRIQVSSPNALTAEGGDAFLRMHSCYSLTDLSRHLENNFRRITLVNKQMSERLTIDTQINFYNFCTGKETSLDDIAIIELKRDGYAVSPMYNILRQLRIQPESISKYCVGTVLTNQTLKYNRFKPKLRHLERIRQHHN